MFASPNTRSRIFSGDEYTFSRNLVKRNAIIKISDQSKVACLFPVTVFKPAQLQDVAEVSIDSAITLYNGNCRQKKLKRCNVQKLCNKSMIIYWTYPFVLSLIFRVIQSIGLRICSNIYFYTLNNF